MIRAKKSLGQNFLKDKKTLNLIAQKAIDINLPILEVGPGKGALTKYLLDSNLVVFAIEKDHRLIDTLKETFTEEMKRDRLRLTEGDALEFIPEQIFSDNKFQVVANLPYYITGMYLRRTLEHNVRPQAITLMLQKEVVDRIVARDGKDSLLSISVKAFGTPSKLCNVSARHFNPAPKVDSAVLHVAHISDSQFTEHGVSIEQFFRVVKAGFSSKRKMLKNNLSDLIKESDIDFDATMSDMEKPAGVRAEVLDIDDWFSLAKLLT